MWYFWFVVSLIVSQAMARLGKKHITSEQPNGAAGWDPRTTQRDGIPYEYPYGRCPVEGNIFSAHTTVTNTFCGANLFYVTNFVVELLAAGEEITVRTSNHQIHTRVGFGDGPVKGLVSGYSRVNGRPIGDLTGVTTAERLGTDNQTATAMGDRAEFSRNDKVVSGTPVTVLMPDADYDDVAIMLHCPEGLIQYKSSGERVAQAIGVKIEIREVGGAWHTLKDGGVFGKTINPIRWIFTASESYYGGTPFTVTKGTQHEWRVTCTWSSSRDLSQGTLYVSAVQEIYNDGHRFPGMAFLELRAIATEPDGDAGIRGGIGRQDYRGRRRHRCYRVERQSGASGKRHLLPARHHRGWDGRLSLRGRLLPRLRPQRIESGRIRSLRGLV